MASPTFRPVTPEEREKLTEALRINAQKNTSLFMDTLTTGWKPDDGIIPDEEVIDAIRSVPCHY